jgi:hypothetical protein
VSKLLKINIHYLLTSLKIFITKQKIRKELDNNYVTFIQRTRKRKKVTQKLRRCRCHLINQTAATDPKVIATAKSSPLCVNHFGVREARTLDLRITQPSYETYALANCATTPVVIKSLHKIFIREFVKKEFGHLRSSACI